MASFTEESKTNSKASLIESESNSKRKCKRIAIYGGSFDPITDAHLTMCASIIHSRAADEVWVVPCGQRPDKPSLKTSVADRFLMVHLAIESTFTREFPLKLCPIELVPTSKGKPAYQTIDMFIPSPDATVRKDYPPLSEWLSSKERENFGEKETTESNIEFVFACGTDILTWIHTWAPERGKWYNTIGFIVFPRPGDEVPQEFLDRENVRVLGAEFDTDATSVFCNTNLSSSEIRRRIAAQINSGTSLKAKMGNYLHLAEGLLSRAVIKYILSAGLLHDDDSSRSNNNKKKEEEDDEEKDDDDEDNEDNDDEMEEKSQESGTTSSLARLANTEEFELRQNSQIFDVSIRPSNQQSSHPSQQRKIGIFGGSFDPITNGHLKIAAEAIHSSLVDEVWLIPCGSRPDKPSMLRTFNDRWTM